MNNFVRLIGTNNIVELDQIKLALHNAGINVQTQNEASLLVGNVEFTGIAGASIFVDKDQYLKARRVLQDLGLDDGGNDSGALSRGLLIGIAVVLILILLSAIFLAA